MLAGILWGPVALLILRLVIILITSILSVGFVKKIIGVTVFYIGG